jgi:hypothetical protein
MEAHDLAAIRHLGAGYLFGFESGLHGASGDLPAEQVNASFESHKDRGDFSTW